MGTALHLVSRSMQTMAARGFAATLIFCLLSVFPAGPLCSRRRFPSGTFCASFPAGPPARGVFQAAQNRRILPARPWQRSHLVRETPFANTTIITSAGILQLANGQEAMRLPASQLPGSAVSTKFWVSADRKYRSAAADICHHGIRAGRTVAACSEAPASRQPLHVTIEVSHAQWRSFR